MPSEMKWKSFTLSEWFNSYLGHLLADGAWTSYLTSPVESKAHLRNSDSVIIGQVYNNGGM